MKKAKTEAEKREARMMRAVMAYGRACEECGFCVGNDLTLNQDRAAAKKDRALDRVRDTLNVLVDAISEEAYMRGLFHGGPR